VAFSAFAQKIGLRWRQGAESGSSAVEFAIICPLLVAGLLAAADLGLAINRKMTVDAMLRAGAEAAISDPGITKVRDVASYAAGNGVPSDMSISATRSCACPENISAAVSCSTVCASSKSPYVFYTLGADGFYNPILLPRIALHSSLAIQVK
jgi:pilus assembly protein CpaE